MKITLITKVSLINGLILSLLTLSEFLGMIKFEMIVSYQWHKIFHIIGVVIFMGNMLVGPVWFLYAFYSKDRALLLFANKLMQVTDLYLTVPGIALTVLNGLFLASAFGGSANLPWLLYSVILLFIMWGFSIPLIYIQEKLYSAIALEPENRGKINSLLIKWSICGTVVMIPPSIIFYLMIVKNI